MGGTEKSGVGSQRARGGQLPTPAPSPSKRPPCCNSVDEETLPCLFRIHTLAPYAVYSNEFYSEFQYTLPKKTYSDKETPIIHERIAILF